jgi:hypothetical protein
MQLLKPVLQTLETKEAMVRSLRLLDFSHLLELISVMSRSDPQRMRKLLLRLRQLVPRL